MRIRLSIDVDAQQRQAVGDILGKGEKASREDIVNLINALADLITKYDTAEAIAAIAKSEAGAAIAGRHAHSDENASWVQNHSDSLRRAFAFAKNRKEQLARFANARTDEE